MKSNLRKSLDTALILERNILQFREILTQLMLQHPDLDDHLVSALYRFCQVLKGAEDVFANEVVAPIIEDMRIFGEEGIEKYLRVEKRDDEG